MRDAMAPGWPGAGTEGPRPGGPPLAAGPPPVPEHVLPRLVDRAPGRLLGWVVVGGVAFDVGLRGGVANLVVAGAVAVVIAALVTDGRLAQREARVLALLALLPAAGLAVRASPWLASTNLLAIGALLAMAIVLSRSGSVLDTTPARLVVRASTAALRALAAPTALAPLGRRLDGPAARRLGRVGVAVVIAFPLLFLVTVLLAAADPVFAGLVTPDVELGPLVGHVVLASLFALVVLVVLAAALVESGEGEHRGRFGVVEVATMLGLATAVLALFVVSQLLALTDAGDRLVEAAGLTPAEYARSGFFQLCWAAALLVGFLGGVGFLAGPRVMAHRTVRALAAAVPLLALGLVAVSLRRMALYDEAFGLTMLRLWVVGATLWMGSALLMMAARHAGLAADRNWVLGGATASALALVVAANVVNCEAFVVRHNVARAEAGAELDLPYLAALSDDAVPALVDELGPAAFAVEHDPYDGRRPQRCSDGAGGAAALNLAVARAADVRHDAC